MKLPIFWATKTPIPFTGLSITGKGPHPDNGGAFKRTPPHPAQPPPAQPRARQTPKPEANTLLTTKQNFFRGVKHSSEFFLMDPGRDARLSERQGRRVGGSARTR